jgi:AraC-like DNA-binding protein
MREDAFMLLKQTRSAGEGLERLCRASGRDWIASAGPVDGVELFRASFVAEAYRKHRHDTYAVGLTDTGVQVFDYRGAVRVSLPGQVAVLYPDEVHDGRAGTAAGFGYRIVYVEPARLADALRVICGRPYPLPFLRDPVTTNARLARAICEAFSAPLEPLAVDNLVVELAEGLLAGVRAGGVPVASRHVDARAVERARRLLDAQRTRTVRSAELEAVTGLTRYDLARQFRIALGTSPHRYQVMRRLEHAREAIHHARPLAAAASEAGFADQAHFTRAFTAAFGLTPGRYRALRGRLAEGRFSTVFP